MNFDYDDFMHQANADYLRTDHTQRYGQFLMNQLAKDYPDIQVPDRCDCFYDNSKCSNLLRYLSSISDSLFESQ